MNNNSNNPLTRCFQSSTSITQGPPGSVGQMPFMFGGSSGFGTPGQAALPRPIQSSQSNMNFSQFRRETGQNSVRDCMFWPGSLSAGQGPARGGFGGRGVGGRPFGGQSIGRFGGRPASMGMGMGAAAFSSQTMPSVSAVSNPNCGQPGAYILNGNGQGEARKGMALPFQLAPQGAQLGPLATMEPVTVKLTAPPGAGAGGAPISFQISPNQLWGGR